MKNTTEKFHKKVGLYQIPDRAKTEVESMRQSRGRGSKVETEARLWGRGEAEPVKKLPRGRLEPRQISRGLHPCFNLVPADAHFP